MIGLVVRRPAAAALLLALACDPPAGDASATAAPASTGADGSLPLFDPPEQYPEFVSFGVCAAPA